MTATATEVSATVDRDTLLSLLQSCAKAVARRSTIPILKSARVTFNDGRIAMRTTDLDLTIDCSGVADSHDESWSFVCDHARLLDLAKAMPQGDIHLSRDERALTVKSGLAEISIPFEYDVDKYTFNPELGAENYSFEIAADEMVWLLRQVGFAAAQETSAFIIKGVIVTRTKSGLEAAATNGHRLAVAAVPLRPNGQPSPAFVLPTYAVNAILTREWDAEATLAITVCENHVTVRYGDYALTARREDIQTPSYRNEIPDLAHVALINPETLASALKRIALVAGEPNRCVAMSLKSGRLTLSVKSTRGEGREPLPTDYSGPDCTYGVDYPYLLDYLSSVESPMLEMQLAADDGIRTPLVFRPSETPEGHELIYAISPMRIYWDE